MQEDIKFAGPSVTAGYSLTPGGSGTSDSTGQLASRIGDKISELRYIEHELKMIDLAVSMLSEPKQLIIKVRYLTEDGMDKGAAITLRNHSKKYGWRVMCHGTYERLRNEAVAQIAGILGDKENVTITTS